MAASGSWHMEEDRLGLRIQSETVEIQKDEKGLIGVCIGGGDPHCPCVYVVQVVDNSPAALDGRIQCGDEIVAVNGINVKGERKQAVASLIQCSLNPVKITINKLEASTEQGRTLDIVFKKAKHRLMESLDQESADALGLTRAILCNDPLIQKIKILESNTALYQNLISYFKDLLHAEEKISHYQKVFGDVFCDLAAHEWQSETNKAFSMFGASHRLLAKHQSEYLKQLKPMVNDLVTYVDKVVPDTELTLKKYLDVKHEYLSFCLKLKEMDDEETELIGIGEVPYRVETGNYEYRLMLRCRQESKKRFVQMRNDVIVKIELLDQKHVRDIAQHLSNFASTMRGCQEKCTEVLREHLVPPPVDIEIGENCVPSCSADELEQAVEAVEEPVEPPPADLLGLNTEVTPEDPSPRGLSPIQDHSDQSVSNLIDFG